MTNQEIEDEILNWSGAPFLVGEYATELGVTWHRMNRIVRRLVKEGKLFPHNIQGWTGYSKFAVPRGRFEFISDILLALGEG